MAGGLGQPAEWSSNARGRAGRATGSARAARSPGDRPRAGPRRAEGAEVAPVLAHKPEVRERARVLTRAEHALQRHGAAEELPVEPLEDEHVGPPRVPHLGDGSLRRCPNLPLGYFIDLRDDVPGRRQAAAGPARLERRRDVADAARSPTRSSASASATTSARSSSGKSDGEPPAQVLQVRHQVSGREGRPRGRRRVCGAAPAAQPGARPGAGRARSRTRSRRASSTRTLRPPATNSPALRLGRARAAQLDRARPRVARPNPTSSRCLSLNNLSRAARRPKHRSAAARPRTRAALPNTEP